MPAMPTVARQDVRGSAQGNYRKVGALIRSYARRAKSLTKPVVRARCAALPVAYFEKHVLIASPKPINAPQNARRLRRAGRVFCYAAILALAAIAGNAKHNAVAGSIPARSFPMRGLQASSPRPMLTARAKTPSVYPVGGGRRGCSI